MADPNDKRVKELLDPATRADLERWFSLPSFTQLAERDASQPPPAGSTERAEAQKRVDEALAAVDPAMLEAHRRRVEPDRELSRFKQQIEVRIDPSLGEIDLAMLAGRDISFEPREVEIPDRLRDDLRICTPQALLRDLHRPEMDYQKTFEIVDAIAENQLDASAVIAEVMATRLDLPPPGLARFHDARTLLLEVRALRRRPWVELNILESLESVTR